MTRNLETTIAEAAAKNLQCCKATLEWFADMELDGAAAFKVRLSAGSQMRCALTGATQH